MGEHSQAQPQQDLASRGNTILLVGNDGAVLQCLERGAYWPSDDDNTGDNLPVTLDALWEGPVVRELHSLVRRSIRARRSFNEILAAGPNATRCGLISVPQGRDRAMLILTEPGFGAVVADNIAQLAYEDADTGLPNRAQLCISLQRITELQGLRGGRAAVLSLYCGGLDDYGQSLCAREYKSILRQVAERLREQIRGSNESLEADLERVTLIARTDYREFTVVLPAIETGEDAEAVAKRIIALQSESFPLAGHSIYLSPRVGISLYPQDGTDATGLLHNAHVAMEDASQQSEACIRLHSGTVRMRALQRQDLRCELDAALQREEFELNFLPVVRASDGYPVAMEALLRWPDSLLDGGSIDKVVAVAERTGVMGDIGRWVFSNALAALKGWHRAGYTSLRLALNLSAQQFADAGLQKDAASLLDEAGIDGRFVDLEINEHMLLRDSRAGFERIRQLQSTGIKIVVDDFGTGPSTLIALSQSGIDGLKIDRTLVANLVVSKSHSDACAAACRITRSLGVVVTAEGVETECQAEFLREQGCDLMQGFLFSRPLSNSDVSDYLAITGGYRLDDMAERDE